MAGQTLTIPGATGVQQGLGSILGNIFGGGTPSGTPSRHYATRFRTVIGRSTSKRR
jgi:hypothetical protein